MASPLRALGYPFSKANRGVTLLGAAAFVLVPAVLSLLPFSLPLVLAVQLFLLAYYAVFLHSILDAARAGRDEFPAWPDSLHGIDLAEDVFAMAGPYVISFLPLIILRCLYTHFGALAKEAWGYATLILSGPMSYELPDVPAWFQPVSWGLAALGLFYLPMAILVWSFYGGTSILNPVAVIRSAARTGPGYLLLVALLAALLFGLWGTERALAHLPLEGPRSLLTALARFYVLIVGMRLIGSHYFVNRDRLGWERTDDQFPVPSPRT